MECSKECGTIVVNSPKTVYNPGKSSVSSVVNTSYLGSSKPASSRVSYSGGGSSGNSYKNVAPAVPPLTARQIQQISSTQKTSITNSLGKALAQKKSSFIETRKLEKLKLAEKASVLSVQEPKVKGSLWDRFTGWCGTVKDAFQSSQDKLKQQVQDFKDEHPNYAKILEGIGTVGLGIVEFEGGKLLGTAGAAGLGGGFLTGNLPLMEGSASAVVKGVLLGTAGGSDFIEGLHKIYLGVTGQGEKERFNIIRDGLFHGDSASYDQAKITLGLSSLISLFQITPGVNTGSQPTSHSASGNGEVFDTEAVVGADGKITYVPIIENTQLPAVSENLVPSVSTETTGGIIEGPVIVPKIEGVIEVGKNIVDGAKINGKRIGDMNKQEIIDSVPNDWRVFENNGFVHIKDEKGITRIRIDPSDKITPIDHIHIYDELENPLSIDGIIKDRKSPEVHIPLKK